MDYLVDSNILLRRVQPNSPQRPVVRRALRVLAGRGDSLCITAQNLHEFWYVATRSVVRNGLGLTPVQAARKLQVLRHAFRFLPDTQVIYTEWEGLVTSLGISDARSFDARLVAVMRVYGLTHVLTFNGADFALIPGIIVVDPASV
jgi:predicted nucleic acid-binding protein